MITNTRLCCTVTIAAVLILIAVLIYYFWTSAEKRGRRNTYWDQSGHPGYGDYHDRPRETNNSAVISLVLGLASLTLGGPLLAIPAIIFGHMAKKEIRANPWQEGEWMAQAGIVIGWVVTAISVILLIFYFSIILLIFR